MTKFCKRALTTPVDSTIETIELTLKTNSVKSTLLINLTALISSATQAQASQRVMIVKKARVKITQILDTPSIVTGEPSRASPLFPMDGKNPTVNSVTILFSILSMTNDACYFIRALTKATTGNLRSMLKAPFVTTTATVPFRTPLGINLALQVVTTGYTTLVQTLFKTCTIMTREQEEARLMMTPEIVKFANKVTRRTP